MWEALLSVVILSIAGITLLQVTAHSLQAWTQLAAKEQLLQGVVSLMEKEKGRYAAGEAPLSQEIDRGAYKYYGRRTMVEVAGISLWQYTVTGIWQDTLRYSVTTWLAPL